MGFKWCVRSFDRWCFLTVFSHLCFHVVTFSMPFCISYKRVLIFISFQFHVGSYYMCILNAHCSRPFGTVKCLSNGVKTAITVNIYCHKICKVCCCCQSCIIASIEFSKFKERAIWLDNWHQCTHFYDVMSAYNLKTITNSPDDMNKTINDGIHWKFKYLFCIQRVQMRIYREFLNAINGTQTISLLKHSNDICHLRASKAI